MVVTAVDCHAHVFDTSRFPYAADTIYHPLPGETATKVQYAEVLQAHGVSHALLVGPTSGYNSDNRCLLDALATSGGRFRGIVRVPVTIDDRSLDAMGRRGVVGVRLDLVGDGTARYADPAVPPFLARLAERGWVVQVQCEGDQLAGLAGMLRACPAQIVVDHCGRPDPALGLRQPGFRDLLALGGTGRAAVKLSGAFRFSRKPWPHADTDRYVAAILAAFGPENCVWGSDWPFLRAPTRLDYAPVQGLLERWVPRAADRRRILRDTPKRLFGFR